MKRTGQMVMIMLASMIGVWTHAQSKPVYTTVVIDYVGKTDRPVFPIIISSSVDEAEWCKQKLFSDPVSTFAHVYIVRESTLKKVAGIPLPSGEAKSPNSGEGPSTAPTLRLVLATGHDFKEVTVEVGESVSLLSEIEKRAAEYPPLVEQLSDIGGRMNRYLKKSH